MTQPIMVSVSSCTKSVLWGLLFNRSPHHCWLCNRSMMVFIWKKNFPVINTVFSHIKSPFLHIHIGFQYQYRMLPNPKLCLIAEALNSKFHESFDNDGVRFGNDKGSKVLISTWRLEVIAEMGKMSVSSRYSPLRRESMGVVPEKSFHKSCCSPSAVNAAGTAMSLKKSLEDWSRALLLSETLGERHPN